MDEKFIDKKSRSRSKSESDSLKLRNEINNNLTSSDKSFSS